MDSPGLLARLVRAYDRVVDGLAAVAAVIIGMCAVLIVVDVSIRTLGFSPPAYTIALVEYGLLYVAMLAAPWLLRTRRHVYIDAVVSHLPRPLEAAVSSLGYLVSIVTCLTFALISAQLLLAAVGSGIVDERGVDMPLWSLYLPLPIGFGLVAVEFARMLVSRELMHRTRHDAGGAV